jgi:hypothetical protein
VNYTDDTIQANFDTFYTDLAQKVSLFRNERYVSIFPFTAFADLSDGNEYELPVEYIGASIAGLEMVNPKQYSLKQNIVSGFKRLGITRLTRTQQNKIAALGYTVLSQPKFTESITVRDWIATDRSEIQREEPSIVNVYDYIWLRIVNAINPYLRNNVIDATLIERMKATIKTEGVNMAQKQSLFDRMDIITFAQDEIDKRKVYCKVRVYMLYPFKYFDVDVITE